MISYCCLECGYSFTGRKRKYCDRMCGLAHRNGYRGKAPERHLTCLNCGNTFTAQGMHAAGSRRYCDEECRKAYGRTHWNRKPKVKVKRAATCRVCGNSFETANRADYCSMVCYGISRRIDPTRVAAKNHAGRASRFGVKHDSSVTRIAVLERDAWLCGLCGSEIPRAAEYPSKEYGSIDHVLPMSLGGGHVWSNVQAAHLGCNIAKGATDGTTEQAARAA